MGYIVPQRIKSGQSLVMSVPAVRLDLYHPVVKRSSEMVEPEMPKSGDLASSSGPSKST